jgi:hypothetical protein
VPTDQHPQKKPRVDEIVANRPAFLHYEQLDHRAGWMRISLENGSSIDVQFRVNSGRLEVYAEES